MPETSIPAPIVVADTHVTFPIPENLVPYRVTGVLNGSIEKNGTLVEEIPVTFETGDTLHCMPTPGELLQVIGERMDFPLPAASASDIEELISEDSPVQGTVVSDQLVLTVQDLQGEVLQAAMAGDSPVQPSVGPDHRLTLTVQEAQYSALRHTVTTTRKVLVSNPTTGQFELIDYAPASLYETGGFVIAPIALQQDQPDETPWNLLTSHFTDADTDVQTGAFSGINVQPQNGLRSYQPSQTLRSDWTVHFTCDRPKRIPSVTVAFAWTGSMEEATFKVEILDGSTVVAEKTKVVQTVNTTNDREAFVFDSMATVPANAKIRLTRVDGAEEVVPGVNQTVIYSNHGVATDWVARDSAGDPITTSAYPGGLQIDISLDNIHDLVEAEPAVVDDTTTYDVSGMHLTRLNVATSNISTLIHQYCTLEVTFLPALHGDLLEGVSIGVQRDRSLPEQLYRVVTLLRDETGLTTSSGVVLETGVSYRFEFDLTAPTSGNATCTYKIFRSSDGMQMTSPVQVTISNCPNPLFGVLSLGEAGVYEKRGVNVARPMPVRIHRWVEWRSA